MWYNKASAELCNPVLLQLRGKKWPHWAQRAHEGIIEMMFRLSLEVEIPGILLLGGGGVDVGKRLNPFYPVASIKMHKP